MRQISFRLTAPQIRTREKTVTRRLGWTFLTPGTRLQPVVQQQGLRKGARVERIGGPITVVSVRREPLCFITESDCAREGFPQLTPVQFMELFERSHKGAHGFLDVTRIEFAYVDNGKG